MKERKTKFKIAIETGEMKPADENGKNFPDLMKQREWRQSPRKMRNTKFNIEEGKGPKDQYECEWEKTSRGRPTRQLIKQWSENASKYIY